MSSFKDYYKILQVHFDASDDVIKAAYRKLCTLYHPDSTNSDAFMMAKMQEINEAYDALKTPDKRTIYHKAWLKHFTDRTSHVHYPETIPVSCGLSEARRIMDCYFHALYTGNWLNAYDLIALEDRARISVNDFINWKTAVACCYKMQSYTLAPAKLYNNYRIADTYYETIVDFKTTVADTDMQTNETSRNISHKFAVYDGSSWKVCLGVNDVKAVTSRYQLMSERSENYNPLELYKSATKRYDTLTGLYSKYGFYAETEREVMRSKRYGNPVSIACFKIESDKSANELNNFIKCASTVRSTIRFTDYAANFDNKYIVCLFTETDRISAMTASDKIVNAIKGTLGNAIHITKNISAYMPGTLLENTVKQTIHKFEFCNSKKF